MSPFDQNIVNYSIIFNNSSKNQEHIIKCGIADNLEYQKDYISELFNKLNIQSYESETNFNLKITNFNHIK